tara:strand:- start:4244 stop:5017 length:774 start_codon:yes stop_codon:yes gene_type:complete
MFVTYSPQNAKTKKLLENPDMQKWNWGEWRSLDILSGYSCPMAKLCHSKAAEYYNEKTGKFTRKIQDGKHTEFRCFSASQETRLAGVYNRRKQNFDLLKKYERDENAITDILLNSWENRCSIMRPHVAGDYFSREYMLAWFNVAIEKPETLFYSYTKSLHWLIEEYDKKPDNFIFTASRGGFLDHYIGKYDLREAVVVYSEKQASELGLEIDHDDSHAANPKIKDQSFALLIHGTQPAGSEAAKALVQLNGKGSYRK